MEKNLAKSLTDLIDETLAEIEALKKSDRFSPESIEMGGDADGSTDTESVNKADDEDKDEHEEEEKEEEHEDEAKKAEETYKKAEEECEKAEKTWKDAMSKKDMCKAEHDKHMEKAEGVNSLAKADDKKAQKIKKMEKKLAKSIEARVAPLESQIAQVLEAVKQLSDAPVPARGATYKNVQPLAKGASEIEPLNKARVLDDLITLKKSGKEVSIEDVLKAEIGSEVELNQIATKYGIK